MIISSKGMLYKSYLIGLGLFIFSFCIIIQLVKIQNSSQRKKYKQFAKGTTLKIHSIAARRGDIYDMDENLLATTITKYDIHVDLKCIPDKYFKKEDVLILSRNLEKILGKPKDYFYHKLYEGRKKKNQYFLIARRLTYEQYKTIKKLPIINRGRIKGGLIIEQKNTRIYPLENLAKRTLGYDDHRGKAGLEGAFSPFLKGKEGRDIKQLIGPNLWKSINNPWDYIPPKEGMDVYATIDINIQEIAYNALLKQLINLNAQHGCVIVMDVKTAQVHAIVNLEKTSSNTYEDLRNFAIWEAAEPGSTFKTMVLLAGLIDKKFTPETLVDTQEGIYSFKGKSIRDSNRKGYGLISCSDVLSFSSNIGMAKLITNAYKETPKKLLEHFTRWGLHNKIGLEIPGEGIPFIPKPKEKGWSGLTLAWLSFGYNLKLTPLQILAFYNGIANDGDMLKPLFIKKIQTKPGEFNYYHPKLIAKIAPHPFINQIKTILEEVFKKGTGKKYYNKDYPYAGKTGTTQVDYHKKNIPKSYSSSFVGYFPTNAPKYSAIVVVSKPKNAYYGSEVALPVFDEIAKTLYPKIGRRTYPLKAALQEDIPLRNNPKKSFTFKEGIMPDLIGYPGKDIIAILEKKGIKVKYEGIGNVLKQSIPEGEKIKKDQTLYLILEE